MSRTEELRNKLRKKPNVELIKFDGAVEAIVNKRSASATASSFTRALYERYLSDKPANVDEWLSRQLDGLFVSEFKPPEWRDEMDWCFFENQPMIFLHQFKDHEGCIFYVFRGTSQKDGSVHDVYKMLAHRREGRVILEGVIHA